MTYDSKTSADLEREVAEQRNRLEARIDEIKDRLSPGQLLDEALSYTKNGGAHFASNLAGQVSANPIPAALVGIGLAWLMSGKTIGGAHHETTNSHSSSFDSDSDDYPYARVTGGGLRRVSHTADESGQWWSEFETASGDRYKARSDQHGHRAGHFTDAAGKIFSGFVDEAGNRVRDFQDEAGNMIAQARGWADHGWRRVRHSVTDTLSGAGSAARDAASGVMSGSRHLGSTVQQQSDQLSRQVVKLFDEQPLVAGALAFAVGAAMGAALPRTAQEDKLVGEQADKLRGKAMREAGKLYEHGKEKAAELYEDATSEAGRLYGDVKDKVADITNGQAGVTSLSRH